MIEIPRFDIIFFSLFLVAGLLAQGLKSLDQLRLGRERARTRREAPAERRC